MEFKAFEQRQQILMAFGVAFKRKKKRSKADRFWAPFPLEQLVLNMFVLMKQYSEWNCISDSQAFLLNPHLHYPSELTFTEMPFTSRRGVCWVLKLKSNHFTGSYRLARIKTPKADGFPMIIT